LPYSAWLSKWPRMGPWHSEALGCLSLGLLPICVQLFSDFEGQVYPESPLRRKGWGVMTTLWVQRGRTESLSKVTQDGSGRYT
jgi:hypothetical protein